jgi:hypothetical protein
LKLCYKQDATERKDPEFKAINSKLVKMMKSEQSKVHGLWTYQKEASQIVKVLNELRVKVVNQKDEK